MDEQRKSLVSKGQDVDVSRHTHTSSVNDHNEVAQFIDENDEGSLTDTAMARQINMKSSRYSYIAGAHGLTVFNGALAILSTCVGGGIVGLPLAMYNLGIPLAIFLQILVMLSTHLSSKMYLYVKDLVPDSPDSLYEIGYMILGRGSIFFLCSVFIINSFGLCMIYFIVFGDTAGQFVAQTFTDGEELNSVWYTTRWCYSVPLAAVLLPICLKKELAELAWISMVLFVSLGLFTLCNFIQLTFDSNFAPEGISTEVLSPKLEWDIISALSVTMLAYSYQQNIFPIYSELKEKNNETYGKVSKIALPLTGSIYFAVGIICSLMFGKTLESSVLLNIGYSRHSGDPTKGFWEAYICQISFMVVLMCHIPFIFFSGKEALLTVIDEIQRKSISSALWHKLQANPHFQEAPEHQDVPNPDLPIPGDDVKMTFSSVVIRQSEANLDPKDAMRQSRMRSQAIMSHISAPVAQRLALQEMSYVIYLIASISFYGLIVLLAMLLTDISTVFDFVSAYSVSSIAFFIPAMFYKRAAQKFGADLTSPEVSLRLKVCILFFVLGSFNAVLGISSALLTITGATEGGH